MLYNITGNYLCKSFNRQCSEHKTKVEYDRSHDLLSEVLLTPECKAAIGDKCIAAVQELQMKLRTKERYLANYRRNALTMCMQAKTTSPVESMNNITKHGSHAVDSNMNLSKSVQTMTDGADARLGAYENDSIREMGIRNRASHAPTKDDVHRKTQYLMDQNWDCRLQRKYAQVAPNEWLSWSFFEKKIIYALNKTC